MSAYSLVSHRMFVAALSNNSESSPPLGTLADTGPERAGEQAHGESRWRMPGAPSPRAGTLLANALMQGYHAPAT